MINNPTHNPFQMRQAGGIVDGLLSDGQQTKTEELQT
jgi:hypothetical protein